MKARGLASPDLADTLAMSFAVKVRVKDEPLDPDLEAELNHIRTRLRLGFGHWI